MVFEILRSSLSIFIQMSPYLILGFLMAGVLYVLIPRSWVTRHLGGRGWRSVLKGALVGIPLPLCSCGVIPFSSSLQKQGAGRGPTTSFLIATPQTGVDSILVTYSFLGLPFALYRVLAALVTGVVGGSLAAATDGRSQAHEQEVPSDPPRLAGLVPKLRAASRFGLDESIRDVAVWLVVGVLLAGLIEVLLPAQALSPERLGGSLVSMLVVVVVALPMYVCATASVPIAAALVAKGMPLGAALVFLVAGPATNAATLSVFTSTLGRRIAAIYAGTIVICSVLLGWVFEVLTGGELLARTGLHDHASTPWWAAASAVLLALLLLRALVGIAKDRWRRDVHSRPATGNDPGVELQIQGMTCHNCRRQVEQALRTAAPSGDVRVDLESGRAEVQGEELDVTRLVGAVREAGYQAEET